MRSSASRSVVTWQTAAAGSSTASLHTSSSTADHSPDPFTQSLQNKTEQELLQLLEKRLAEQQQQGADDEAEAGDDEGSSDVNPETGELPSTAGACSCSPPSWQLFLVHAPCDLAPGF